MDSEKINSLTQKYVQSSSKSKIFQENTSTGFEKLNIQTQQPPPNKNEMSKTFYQMNDSGLSFTQERWSDYGDGGIDPKKRNFQISLETLEWETDSSSNYGDLNVWTF